MNCPVYLEDLKPDYRKDAFLGNGAEELKATAEEKDCRVIVGYYLDRPIIEE